MPSTSSPILKGMVIILKITMAGPLTLANIILMIMTVLLTEERMQQCNKAGGMRHSKQTVTTPLIMPLIHWA